MRRLFLRVLALVSSITAAAQAEAPEGPASLPPARDEPIRSRRPFAIAGEVGWNGLAGLGVNFSYHPIPYLAIDAGAGLGLAGLKGGLRLRANLLTSAWSPVIGAGFLYEVGSGGEAVKVETQGESAMVEIFPSPYAQLVAGVSYTGDEGFVLMGTTGYAILLRDNTRLVSGSAAVHEDTRALVGGGFVASATLGYAF